jgi:hypothetical protein
MSSWKKGKTNIIQDLTFMQPYEDYGKSGADVKPSLDHLIYSPIEFELLAM